MSTRRTSTTQPTEDGAGVLSTALGILFALTLVLFCIQVLLSLYARSMVSAAAYDGARMVATSNDGDDHDAVGDATERVRLLIGAMNPSLDWSRTDREDVVLKVTAKGPALFPKVGVLQRLSRVERTARVRREQFS